MKPLVPHEWSNDLPEILVAGDGCYATALAATFGATLLPSQKLMAGATASALEQSPRVLNNLKRAILVVSDSMAPGDALRCHESIWNWVERLSSTGDQHDLAFLFILPADASSQYEAALAAGLGLDRIDPASTGHAVWRQLSSLAEMLDKILQIQPTDLLTVRARRAADSRRRALAELQRAVAQDDLAAASAAVRAVLAAFQRQEYNLDVFCRPPSHQHGNLLRRWLNNGVTSPVTPDWQAEGRKHLAEWLIFEENGSTQ